MGYENKQTLAPEDFEWLATTLAKVVQSSKMLADIERWLSERPFVAAVSVLDHLLKTNPPQREFLVSFKMEDGGSADKLLSIYELDPRRFQLASLQDRHD